MKISTKGRYALHLMLDIASHQTSDKPVRIKDIAERQNLSNKYLEQIIAALNKAGYVKSLRGAQGGYLLTKKPEEYTAGMILRVMEGSLSPVACLDEEENTCNRQHGCVTVKLWSMMYDAIQGVVDSVTLADMMHWQEEMDQSFSCQEHIN
ncbi:MAG: Rrf2 family transcriptional regulator [Eubacteriales bacterium]|nr:Rrf2 family transcriptional regulator [Eubacteriales bacterium]